MASMQMSLLAVAATVLLAASGAHAQAIVGYTMDLNNVQGGAPQSANMPAILSTNIPAGHPNGVNGGSISTYHNRKTKETSAKFYVKCTGGQIAAGSTYSLAYALDGAPAVTVGSTYTSGSNPFVYLEGLDDGDHTLTVTCTENAFSISTSLPADDTSDLTPLVFKWNVDTVDATIAYTSTEPAFVNTNDVPLSFMGSIAADSYVSSIAWMCSIEPQGATPNYKTCKCANGQACDATIFQKNDADGTFEMMVKMTVTYITCAATNTYCGDITTREVVHTTTWVRDTTAPELVVTSSPAQKSVYFDGKTVKFEFACNAGEMTACSYMCMVDGKNSADGTDDSRSKGPFTCTSGLKIAVKNTTTHSFTVMAMDEAGNTSPWTPLHMFYADGTPPEVRFTKMDDSQVFSADQLASGASYYSAKNDYNIATGGLLLSPSGVAAAIDDSNLNTTDAGYSAVTPNFVVQYSSGSTKSSTAAAGATAKSTYHTVVQFPYDPTKMPYELDGTYGAVLAMKNVNGKYYYNVLETTNANFGTINFECDHPEMVGPAL
jgi:hypothetical protein